MKAWEQERQLFGTAVPVLRSDKEQTWTENKDVSAFYDSNLALDWESRVPGSGAPEKIMLAAIQALENRGYRVSGEGYRLLDRGLAANKEQDYVTLHQVSALLRRELARSQKDEASPYWRYRLYESFEELEKNAEWAPKVKVDTRSDRFREQIYLSWLSQMIGGAMGTMVEGYTSENLYRTFGPVWDYLREPNTYNDDITFELAFLEAFGKKGYEITSEDIALAWVGFIPCGWSAEEIAIRNIKNGIFPPESGTYRNPFCEWIGAQMRAGVCGMAAPGDPRLAARLAFTDARVSHAGNGILGEVFNAVMTSLSFVEQDVRVIVQKAISSIPRDSEYRSVIDFAWQSCVRCADWHEALARCMKRYERYNWIHAYPNACCEIIALYYGEGDFEKTLHLVTMCGVDVDCNAGMIMPVVAVREGVKIPERYRHPAFDRLDTYMRGRFGRIQLPCLVEETVSSVNRAKDSTDGE